VTDFTFVWVIEFREHPDSVHVACVTTTQEKALAWIKAQDPSDGWAGGWWAVYREALDTDPLDAPENHLTLYDLSCNELAPTEPPACAEAKILKATDIIRRMLSTFDREWNKNWREKSPEAQAFRDAVAFLEDKP